MVAFSLCGIFVLLMIAFIICGIIFNNQVPDELGEGGTEITPSKGNFTLQAHVPTNWTQWRYDFKEGTPYNALQACSSDFWRKKDQNSPLSICISAGAEPVTLGCSSAFNSSCTWEEVCPDHDSSLWLSLRSNTGKSELFNVTIEFIQIQAQCRTCSVYTGFRRFLIESRFSFVVTVVLALALAACGVFGWNTRRKRSEEQKKLLENEEKQ